MTLQTLQQLIKLATESKEPGEAESAALQACRFIAREGVELRLPQAARATPKAARDWLQAQDTVDQECTACEEPIPAGEQHWQSLSTRLRYHGGCV